MNLPRLLFGVDFQIFIVTPQMFRLQYTCSYVLTWLAGLFIFIFIILKFYIQIRLLVDNVSS